MVSKVCIAFEKTVLAVGSQFKSCDLQMLLAHQSFREAARNDGFPVTHCSRSFDLVHQLPILYVNMK